jgi:hypothetical protein
MSSSSSPDKPNRLVVALGIATIVLFSANLLSMISQRVWPKLQSLSGVSEQEQVDEATPLTEHRIWTYKRQESPRVYTLQTIKRKKKCYRRHDHSAVTDFDFDFDFDIDSDVDFEEDLESDMNRLERDIEREMQRLNSELSTAKEDVERSVVRLRLNGDRDVLVEERKLDLSELEEKIQGITREFEIRVREHEEAARQGRKQ